MPRFPVFHAHAVAAYRQHGHHYYDHDYCHFLLLTCSIIKARLWLEIVQS